MIGFSTAIKKNKPLLPGTWETLRDAMIRKQIKQETGLRSHYYQHGDIAWG